MRAKLQIGMMVFALRRAGIARFWGRRTDPNPRILPDRRGGGKPETAAAGFSLIELMIVTTLISIVSLAGVFSLRSAPGTTPAAQMDGFARALRYLQAEALFTTHSFAVSFSAEGWEVLRYVEAERRWQRRAADMLHAQGRWGPQTELELQIEARDVLLRTAFSDTPEPDAFLLPTGETTPFILRLSDDQDRSARCEIGGFGELTCQRGG